MLLDQLKSPWPADFDLQPRTAQERLDVIAIQQLKKEAADEIERIRCIEKEGLRERFETMAVSHYYDIDRNPNGEYRNRGTFLLWRGYWECAQTNGIEAADEIKRLRADNAWLYRALEQVVQGCGATLVDGSNPDI